VHSATSRPRFSHSIRFGSETPVTRKSSASLNLHLLFSISHAGNYQHRYLRLNDLSTAVLPNEMSNTTGQRPSWSSPQAPPTSHSGHFPGICLSRLYAPEVCRPKFRHPECLIGLSLLVPEIKVLKLETMGWRHLTEEALCLLGKQTSSSFQQQPSHSRFRHAQDEPEF
jgi:hypothetical protein